MKRTIQLLIIGFIPVLREIYFLRDVIIILSMPALLLPHLVISIQYLSVSNHFKASDGGTFDLLVTTLGIDGD